MKKLRLIFKAGQSDADGKCVGFNYYTIIIEVPETFNNLEVIGGEWVKEEAVRNANAPTQE